MGGEWGGRGAAGDAGGGLGGAMEQEGRSGTDGEWGGRGAAEDAGGGMGGPDREGRSCVGARRVGKHGVGETECGFGSCVGRRDRAPLAVRMARSGPYARTAIGDAVILALRAVRWS